MPSSTRPSGGLEGFAVLVTGGATGIGRACAERLAADGAAVTICGRTPEKLEEAAGRIADAAAHGGSVRFVRADVTVEDDVAAAVKCALEPTGRLDGAVANAGGGGGLGPYHVQDTGEFLAAGGGSFVGMSSIAGHVTHPYFGAYTAGKAGIEAMIRNAADEFGPKQVRFNAIRPGFIATELMSFIPRDSETYRSYVDNTVAHLARFLIGPESRWITGQAINVDGGHALRRGPDFGPFIEPALGASVMQGALPED
jgi:NAD(P)-dependent dehydrogenase (short-subunit alcohol dehydrogenase family)